MFLVLVVVGGWRPSEILKNILPVLFLRLSCPEFDQNKFCYMLTRTSVARIVGQFIIDAFDYRSVNI